MPRVMNLTRPIAPAVQATPDQEALNYKAVTKRRITDKLVWTEVKWNSFIRNIRGENVVLDSQVELSQVVKRAQSTGRKLVFVAE